MVSAKSLKGYVMRNKIRYTLLFIISRLTLNSQSIEILYRIFKNVQLSDRQAWDEIYKFLKNEFFKRHN